MKLLNTLVYIALIPFGTTCIQATPQTSLRGGNNTTRREVEYKEEAEGEAKVRAVATEGEEGVVVYEQESVDHFDNDRNLVETTCLVDSHSTQTSQGIIFSYNEATQDCKENYRMVGYKCYNYNDGYSFDTSSKLRYSTTEDGVIYPKGITCTFDNNGQFWKGGSLTRAKVFCAPYLQHLSKKSVRAEGSHNVYRGAEAEQYVDCGEGYLVASFTCSSTRSNIFTLEEYGTFSKDEIVTDPPEWRQNWNDHATFQYRKYDRYAFCVYLNDGGPIGQERSTTVTVEAICEKRTCNNWIQT